MFLRTARTLLAHRSCYNMNHIQSVWDAKVKQTCQEMYDKGEVVQNTDRIYKPTYTIEFNREGEVLLYSCDPIKHSTVYLKYPYVMYELAFPVCIYQWFNNPLGLDWAWNNSFLFLASQLWVPRMWYFRTLQYKISKMYLLRGGKFVKIETETLGGDRNVSWVETYQMNPLTKDQRNFDDRDNAEFLAQKGQLNYELAVQFDNIQEMGTTTQDTVFKFMKEGIVHHPELFEAAVKGYNIDTTNFVINTAHNLRAQEGNHNY